MVNKEEPKTPPVRPFEKAEFRDALFKDLIEGRQNASKMNEIFNQPEDVSGPISTSTATHLASYHQVTQGTMVMTANVTNSTVTPVSATGLSFAAAASKTYGFRFFIKNTTPAAATAIQFQLTGPPPSADQILQFLVTNWLTGPVLDTEQITAFSTLATNPTTATQIDCTIIEGFLINGIHAGTVQVQFASETAGQEVTVYAGSWGRWDKLD